MDEQAKNKWNAIYANSTIKFDDANNTGGNISRGLLNNGHLIAKGGRALDLACGTGGDAIFLASKGLTVDAWDISDTVIDKISQYAKVNSLNINAQARDINENPPEKNTYDVITVAHYLERSLVPVLINALKPNGLIFYQTFTQEVTSTYTGPSNPDFRLAENELLTLFSDLKVIVYREEGLLGDLSVGFRNEALFIGQKR